MKLEDEEARFFFFFFYMQCLLLRILGKEVVIAPNEGLDKRNSSKMILIRKTKDFGCSDDMLL